EPGIGLGHGFLPVRVDEAACGGGEQTLGQELVPVNAGFDEAGPEALQVGDEMVLGLLGEGLEAGGDQAPGQYPAPLQKAADGLAVAPEDFGIGVNVHGQDVQVPVEEKLPIGIAAEVDAPGPLDLGQKPVQV